MAIFRGSTTKNKKALFKNVLMRYWVIEEKLLWIDYRSMWGRAQVRCNDTSRSIWGLLLRILPYMNLVRKMRLLNMK